MDDETIKRLNQINREFYEITAKDFDETRGRPWPGWERLLPYLKTPLRVLDVGCGNGRLGVFLAESLAGAIAYHGIDSNTTLLERARMALSDHAAVTLSLENRDVVEQPLPTGEYDLVAAFGLLHHIPGRQTRLDFIRRLADCLAPGGLLAFACWRFYEYERFQERIAAPPDDLQFEANDYLLDWRRGKKALRYCHYIDDGEHAALVSAAGLTEAAAYRADGFTGDVNRYSLLRR